jgi:hypothetical protein
LEFQGAISIINPVQRYTPWATVIRRLALMNPSALAQIIPATRQKQNAWLVVV